MLYRAPLKEVREGRLSRRRSYLAVVMQHYPRGLAKESIDEFVHALAPPRELFTEFKALDRESKDHDGAFEAVRYQERFFVDTEGLGALQRLGELARERDVFLVCQCLAPERCHADLLLLMAKHKYAAPTATVRIPYPTFLARLERGEV
jgi:uncharacterized protein YeaO (DUF488 family)